MFCYKDSILLQLSAEGQTNRNQLITNTMTTKEFLEKYPMVQESDLFSIVLQMNHMVEEVYEQMYHSEQDQLDQDQLEEESWRELYESETLEDNIPYQYPEYVIASTSDDMEETYVFPSDEAGVITDFNELASIAKRFGDEHWSDHDLVMQQLPDYQFVKQTALNRTLYKQII
jgi:hypothetical protein